MMFSPTVWYLKNETFISFYYRLFFYISNKSEFDELFSKYWINKLVHEHTKQFLFK